MKRIIQNIQAKFKKSPQVKTDCTIQFEGAECGAASLCTILKFYGKYIPLSVLRYETSVSRDGANAEFIIEAAKKYGLNAKASKANAMYLNYIATYPSIAFWGFNHFLVVEALDTEHAYLADPARGRYRVPLKYFYKKFTGILLEFSPGPNFEKSGRKQFNLSTVFNIIRPYKHLILAYIFLVALASVPTLILAGVVGVFTDRILLDGRIDLALPTFWVAVFASLLAFVLRIVCQALDRRMTLLMTKDLAAQAFQKLHTVPMSFLETRSEGELSQRALLAIRIPELISSGLVRFVSNFIVAVSVLVIVFSISTTIGLVYLIGFIINIGTVIYLTKNRLDLNVSYAIAQAESNSITLEGLGSIEVLKSCGLEFDFIERWIQKYIEQVNQSQILLRDSAKTSVISTSTKFIFSASILVIGGFIIFYSNNLSVGSLISLQFLSALIVIPFMQIPKILVSIQRLDGQLGRFNDLMENYDDSYMNSVLQFSEASLQRAYLNDFQTNDLPSRDNKNTSLSFINLGLRFAPKLPYALTDLNFEFSGSKHLALVGSSGSGKSTILKILAGFLIQTDGKYLINGVPWDKSLTESIRSKIGYVPQFPRLFNGTIRENLLLFNRRSIDDEEIMDISKLTGVDKIIYHNPELLDYHLRDNASNLSGGQRQLFEITRVLLRKPEILLLDEATAALDDKTEEFLLNSLWSSGFRTISAAHRLKSATMGDSILYLDNGVIIETGKPSQLMNRPDSKFSQLLKLES